MAIVAASVLVGARVLASADDTVAVWAVAADTGVGDGLSVDDLVTQRVRFADSGDLERYYTVDDTLPDDLRLVRGLGAGELLPRSALGTSSGVGTVEISLAVAPLRVPTSVVSGSVVDVYVLGSDDGGAGDDDGRGRDDEPGSPALTSVTVVDAPLPEDSFAPSGERQIVIAVPDAVVSGFYALLDSVSDPIISITRNV